MINRKELYSFEVKELEPTGQIEPQDWMTDSDVQSIFNILEIAGFETRFVGGCVRDAIAKRKVNDVDIATTAKPNEAMRLLETAGIKVVPTGIEHGTITAVINSKSYEITTLREDVATDGRHAEVAFSNDWVVDAGRRDFTINAMSATRNGSVYDPFNGLSDLAYGKVIFIRKPSDRIAEDYLRILRFFRFHTSHGRPPISREALAACRLAAGNLKSLSGERVRDEMLKILSANNAPDTLILMNGEKVLKEVLPEASKFGDLRALNWLCTTAMQLDGIEIDPIRNLAILLPADTTAITAKGIASRWRLSNAEKNRLINLTEFPEPDPMAPSAGHIRQLYKIGIDLFTDQCLMTWARETGDDANLPKDRKAAWLALMEMITTWEKPTFPISGEDLMGLGIQEGPKLGALLDQARDWWIDNDCTPDRDACLKKLESFL
ncbi:MAG: CCA tRNA nucleotidyltransferase [Rhodospirillales bacterium]|nr:CCA tRNA nucleotidyltransferase [Rhodospirillales bacterium]